MQALLFRGLGARHPVRRIQPYTAVTTKLFLSVFGFETLRDLPNIEALDDAGLLRRTVTQAANNEPIDLDSDKRDEADPD